MTPEHKSIPPQLTFEDVTRIAKEIMLRDGMHNPTVIVQGSKGSVIAQLPDMPATHEERLLALFSAGSMIAEGGDMGTLKQLFFVCEAWSGAKPDEVFKVCPYQDPRLKEALVIDGLDFESNQHDLAILVLVRDDKGQLTEFSPMEWPQEGKNQVESPLLDAFVQGFWLYREHFH